MLLDQDLKALVNLSGQLHFTLIFFEIISHSFLSFPDEDASRFFTQMKADVSFLARHHIMDYSLLLARYSDVQDLEFLRYW